MHVAARVAALLGELVHDADDGIADEIGLGLELGDVDGVRARQPLDRGGCVLGNDADTRLRGRQRHLDLDVARDQAPRRRRFRAWPREPNASRKMAESNIVEGISGTNVWASRAEMGAIR